MFYFVQTSQYFVFYYYLFYYYYWYLSVSYYYSQNPVQICHFIKGNLGTDL